MASYQVEYKVSDSDQVYHIGPLKRVDAFRLCTLLHKENFTVRIRKIYGSVIKKEGNWNENG